MVSQEELLRVIRWKMGRGVWRERNLRLAQENPEQEIVDRTARALAAVPDPRQPVVEIARLRGVGAATASAVLAALHPADYPFLDKTVAVQVRGLGAPAFTVPYYLAYASALHTRAAALSACCPHEPWNPTPPTWRSGHPPSLRVARLRADRIAELQRQPLLLRPGAPPAGVAELADAHGLGPCGATRTGSSPALGTSAQNPP